MFRQSMSTGRTIVLNWHNGTTLPPAPAAIRPAALSNSHTLEIVVREVLKAKEVAGLRPAYIRSLRQYFKLFAVGKANRSVDSFTIDDLEAWFTARHEKPVTQASNMGRLASLFSYAKRKGYIKENPVDRLERLRVYRMAPAILSPTEALDALQFTLHNQPRFLPCLALGLFAGVRPEELQRLTWSSVDLDHARLTVDTAASKTHRRRIVPLTANLVRWLKLKGDLPMPHVARRRCIRRLREHFGWPRWPQDLLRHTAASYLLALHQDAGRVALSLGHSPQILMRHYHELVTHEQALEFFDI